jgi:CheY-like chemotaxis protein
VLLVDDDAMVRDFMVQELKAAGYVVTAAPDGPAALALLDSLMELDVLVCDLSMPEMGGTAVIREAQARRPGLPAILLTGYAGDPGALPQDGARFMMLAKPSTMADLADCIAILLSQRSETPRAR